MDDVFAGMFFAFYGMLTLKNLNKYLRKVKIKFARAHTHIHKLAQHEPRKL